jgi:hypothetical protein
LNVKKDEETASGQPFKDAPPKGVQTRVWSFFSGFGAYLQAYWRERERAFQGVPFEHKLRVDPNPRGKMLDGCARVVLAAHLLWMELGLSLCADSRVCTRVSPEHEAKRVV